VEIVLRMLSIKHLYNWSYEESERFARDSTVLRQFCRVYLERLPYDTVLKRQNGLSRYLYKVKAGFMRWVRMSVIASNAILVARRSVI